ncbi:ABC transporter substrate-binding protein [Propionivibrio soli]|uniref:ABC transporter substrate-binding protein n=1 Tax=Propionivibrio soli TaxID=2976531 RepID=UPI0021E77EFA|nr:ABC transporter substrate-binding protein [Propionivibrio soli]
MKKSILTALCSALALAAASVPSAHAAELIKVKTAWVAGLEMFPLWYGKNKGWDKEEGLEIEYQKYANGPAQMEALPSGAWNIASTGVGGILVGGMRHDVRIIGAPMPDSDTSNAIYARADSPIFATKGFNKSLPNVFGSPESVKGKNVLVTMNSANHFIAGQWLKALGLQPSEVKLTNMDVNSMLVSFDKNIGDVMSAWTPITTAAEARGYKRVASSVSLDSRQISQFVADRKWVEANPDTAAKFLRVQYRCNQYIRDNISSPEVIDAAVKYYVEVLGDKKLSRDEIAFGVKDRAPLTLQEALDFATPVNGKDKLTKWNNDAAEFFTSVGSYKMEELKKFMATPLVTNVYLKKAAEKPLLK